jgi:phage terminase large subunit-like protein
MKRKPRAPRRVNKSTNVAPRKKPAQSREAAVASLHPAEQYVADVLAGRVPACKGIRLSCERHLRDLADGARRGLHFDRAAAQHALDFFPLLRHSKGRKWANKVFILEPWQQFLTWVLFGWMRADGTRRFRVAYIEIPRKNGKSTLLAGDGLYLTFADGEPGAEVYCVATKKDQARIVFSEAVRMRDKSPALSKHIVKFRDNLNHPGSSSKMEPLGADEDTLDGLNISGALVDELHAHKSRKLWDVIDTATGARTQPLIIAITTAGYDRESICWREHEYGIRILEEIIEDDTYFVFIAALDDPNKWEEENEWAKCNPNFGISVDIDDLRRKAHKAKQQPAALNAFLRLHLNVWTQQETRIIPMEQWAQCTGFDVYPNPKTAPHPRALRSELEERLLGRTCFAGLDLASKWDIASFVKLFPPTDDLPLWIVLPEFWIPYDRVEERVKRDRVPYDVWIREGWLRATEGNVIDYGAIREKILRDRVLYEIRELAFDSWGATQIVSELIAEGVECVEFVQGMKSFAEPMREIIALVYSKKLAHLGNPILRWMASNLVATQDPAGNMKPDKSKSSEKIDGIVATLMALGRAIANPDLDSGAPVVFTI